MRLHCRRGCASEGFRWEGTQPTTHLGSGYVAREVCDGQSLASPGGRPVLSPGATQVTRHGFSVSALCSSFLESAGSPDLLAWLARNLLLLTRELGDRVDTSIDFRFLALLSKASGDLDVSLGGFSSGVRVGPRARLPRLPACLQREEKMASSRAPMNMLKIALIVQKSGSGTTLSLQA